MIAVVFVAESVPTFGPLLDLVGGGTQSFTAIMFPILFYVFLTTKYNLKKDYKEKGLGEWEGVPSLKQ